MSNVVKAQLGEYRAIEYFEIGDLEVKRGDYIIVEVDRSFEFGRVVSLNKIPADPKLAPPAGKVVRVATLGDLKQIENNRMKAKDAMQSCLSKISERQLDMQMIKSEYTFDSSKIIFYFTSEGRVDFRTLVKDLARVFRVRIELKQIGVRDRSKIIKGHGLCGRDLCCGSYMHDFHPLSIKMAKEQNLPLNPSRISGVCGRIKCCMSYEYLVYKEMARSLPRIGDKVDLPEGKGRIVDINVLKRCATVDMGEGVVVRKIFDKKDAPVKRPGNGKEEDDKEVLSDDSDLLRE
ncbi:MAG: stage 0 sporulation family protein [Candidatus Omnitrophica bacterium]|nr:stage 0 sporulation family protein [Candidatus Omnitrophota bacterium]